MNTKLIAEIGINHNGSIDIAKRLIDLAVLAKFDFVKFQKRDPETCVPEKQKKVLRDTPWGEMAYIDYRKMLEFDSNTYSEIDMYCKEKNIKWFASVWDLPSAEFMLKFCDMVKIPSAMLVDDELLRFCRTNFQTVILSTGMSTQEQIDWAVSLGDPNIIMHCNAAYPAKINELNLKYIKYLRDKFRNKIIGYSGHEYGITASIVAMAYGAEWIERHITLDHSMWGSDHISSLEPVGMFKLVKAIKEMETGLEGYCERRIYTGEFEKLKSLRGV